MYIAMDTINILMLLRRNINSHPNPQLAEMTGCE